MKLARWLVLIGVVISVGFLQVAQRNAIFLKGYAIGDRIARAHQQETDVLWLRARVIGLTSPGHLSDAAQAKRLQLVAWSMLTPDQTRGHPVSSQPLQHAEQVSSSSTSFLHVASAQPAEPSGGVDLSD